MIEPQSLRAGVHTLDFTGGRVHLMGVLNLSPESKNVHTVAASLDEALVIADRHAVAGASIIDVGAQSSNLANPEIRVDDEIERLAPIVGRLVEEGHVVSVDTWKPGVARAAVELGAVIINDTGGLQSPEMVALVAEAQVATVAMYLKGDSPLEVGELGLGEELVDQMIDRLEGRIGRLERAGVTNMIVDPGIGITYRVDRKAYTAHQLRVIRALSRFARLGRPVLLPVPRKPELSSTLAMATLGLEHGADILRVHDTAEVAQIARMMGRME